MTATYPTGLPSFLRAGKSRSQPAKFRITEPRRGLGYATKIGTDVPVFWDVTWRFTQEQAQAFQLWFSAVINDGADEFLMDIRTEFGLVQHTCRFMPDGLLPAAEDGDLFTYTATVAARAQVIPAGYSDAAALLAGLPSWSTWAALLDSAATAAVPPA